MNNKVIDRAGKLLAEGSADPGELQAAQESINEWRATFDFPLRILGKWADRSAKEVAKSAVISSRLKRMNSIVLKLQRPKNVQRLSAMQDIGGLRVIFPNLEDVGRWLDQYDAVLENRQLARAKDYIANPKPDGYRSFHVVVPYRPKNPSFFPYGQRQIEIQLRTRLQHAWATAVETVDLFDDQNLKAGGGDVRWRRFFALASNVFSMKERTPTPPGTPISPRAVQIELRRLWFDLKVMERMRVWSSLVRDPPDKANEFRRDTNPSMFLITIDLQAKATYIEGFDRHQAEFANKRYSEIEQEIRNGRSAHTFLVAVDKIWHLREAYPNLYADTGAFIEALARFVDAPSVILW